MKLAELRRPEVDLLDRDLVAVIPTGSMEQHGLHLPLQTDTLLVTTVAERVEAIASECMLLTPTLWMGASHHHLAFAGTVSADSSAYMGSLQSAVKSLLMHGFWRFLVLNGHGGNSDLNSLVLRDLKFANPACTLVSLGYWEFLTDANSVLEGPLKTIRHACEAETSMVLAVRPDLVRMDLAEDGYLEPSPSVPGIVASFDEMTSVGSLGYPSLGTAEKGRMLLDAAVEGVANAVRSLYDGVTWVGQA